VAAHTSAAPDELGATVEKLTTKNHWAVGDGDDDRGEEGDGDGEGLRDGEGEGEGDFDGLGDGDLDGLGDGDLDGLGDGDLDGDGSACTVGDADGPTEGGRWCGDGLTVGAALAAVDLEAAGAVITSGRFGRVLAADWGVRAREGEPAKPNSVRPTVHKITIHTTRTMVALAGGALPRVLPRLTSLMIGDGLACRGDSAR
jgi:hypothetical protein